MRTVVTLSDEDLSTLVGSKDLALAAKAEAAKARLDAPSMWPDIAPHVAALVVDIIVEARSNGVLIYRSVPVSSCRYCEARSTYEKSKRRRTPYEVKIRAVDFARRFVIIDGHVSVGACVSCVDQALPILRAELTAFPVELPAKLQTDGAPAWRRWDRCRCKKCGWSGHDGQLGLLPAVIEGKYPGKCPSCGVERSFLGPDPFERLDGFDVVAASRTVPA